MYKTKILQFAGFICGQLASAELKISRNYICKSMKVLYHGPFVAYSNLELVYDF